MTSADLNISASGFHVRMDVIEMPRGYFMEAQEARQVHQRDLTSSCSHEDAQSSVSHGMCSCSMLENRKLTCRLAVDDHSTAWLDEILDALLACDAAD